MTAKLPFDASLGPIAVTQLEHTAISGIAYPPQLHYSYDFGLPVGADVLSIADGTVVSIVNNVPDGSSLAPLNAGLDAIAYPQLGPGGTGNQVTVYYASLGLYGTYAHLAEGSIPYTQAEIDAGTATVSQGDVLGQIGLTGTGTAPHLHLTYGTTTTGWGGSTSNVYPTTTIADGSVAANPPNTVLLFDEAGGSTLSQTSYQSQNSTTGAPPSGQEYFGATINGIDANDFPGGSVSSAGDVNGDGFDDILIGAPGADPNGRSEAGESYVVFGGTGLPASIDLASLNGSNGFILNGIDVDDRSGGPVSSAGDVNGDGFDDILIGASGADPNGRSEAGESYVVFGGTGLPASIDLASLNGSNGFILNGIDVDDRSGGPVSSAGDVNGDGFDDILIGAVWADPNGLSTAGESYVVFGGAALPASIDLASLNGSNGFVLNGIDPGDSSGGSVSSAGDVNGDGFDDILIGAPVADPNGRSMTGESYVVFGAAALPASIDLASLNGSNGFALNGIDFDDRSGGSVSSAGDVNGDGFDDILIGARFANPNGQIRAGESYVVFGGAALPASIDLASLNGSNGFVLNGIDVGDRSGVAVTVTPGGGSGGPDYSGFTDIAAIGQVAGTAAPEKFDFGSTRGEVVDSGGPGVDAFVFDDFSSGFMHRVLDFEAGDILDVSALTNFTAGDTVSDYVKFGGRATKTLNVDIDGAGTAFGFQDLVRLTDASNLASAQDLYDNGLLYV